MKRFLAKTFIFIILPVMISILFILIIFVSKDRAKAAISGYIGPYSLKVQFPFVYMIIGSDSANIKDERWMQARIVDSGGNFVIIRPPNSYPTIQWVYKNVGSENNSLTAPNNESYPTANQDCYQDWIDGNISWCIRAMSSNLVYYGSMFYYRATQWNGRPDPYIFEMEARTNLDGELLKDTTKVKVVSSQCGFNLRIRDTLGNNNIDSETGQTYSSLTAGQPAYLKAYLFDRNGDEASLSLGKVTWQITRNDQDIKYMASLHNYNKLKITPTAIDLQYLINISANIEFYSYDCNALDIEHRGSSVSVINEIYSP